MILSASGWRGVFAATNNEEDNTEHISPAHRVISAAAAVVFAEYLKKTAKNPVILVGSDTRPTGKAIASVMIPVLLSSGCQVRYAAVTCAPEIMAWARSLGSPAGFIYVSASHNPIGYNGFKFGLTDGGVLAASETAKLTDSFRTFLAQDNCAAKLESLISAAGPDLPEKVRSGMAAAKAQAYKAYFDFCAAVAWGGSPDIAAAVKDGLGKKPLGIVCDFNGSSRTISIDSDFFTSFGIKFDSINNKPGEIVHRILPEGESLEPCRDLLERSHNRDASFLLGFVPIATETAGIW